MTCMQIPLHVANIQMDQPQLWGGLYQSVADLASDAQDFHDPGFDRLRQLEQTKTTEEVFAILKQITPTERDRLNSPLLDLLFTLMIRYVGDWPQIATCATVDQATFLLERNMIDQNNFFIHCCTYGNKDVVVFLLNRGVDIQAVTNNPLIGPSCKGHTQVVELLLDPGRGRIAFGSRRRHSLSIRPGTVLGLGIRS